MVTGLTSINSNFGNLSGQINRSSTSSARDVARLSSGNRITRAGDDVAALSIATRLTSRITSLRSGLTNMSQATSYLQVQDGALSQIDGMLQRMNALTVQSGSSLTTAERGFLNQEFQNLFQEIERTLNVTEFNGVNVFADHFNAASADASFVIPDESLALPAGAIVHYDPTDATTVIDGNGRNASQAGFNALDIAQLLDISGNNNHANQGIANRRPDYVQNVNGTSADAIRFDGINDRMTGTVPTTTNQLTTFTIFNRTSAGGREFLFEYGSAADGNRDIYGANGTNATYYNQPGSTIANHTAFNLNDYHMIETYFAPTTLEVHLDGTQTYSNNGINGRNIPTNQFTLGDDTTSADWWEGDVSEHISFERALTTDERQRVEGYLADKHGLTLPPGHPYVSAGNAIIRGEAEKIDTILTKGDVLGSLFTVDPLRTATFEITDGNNGAFIVNQRDGTIEVNNPERFEVDQTRYNLTILATLDNGQTSSIPMTIDVGFSGLLFQTDREASESFEVDIREFTLADVFGAQAIEDGFDISTAENAILAENIVQAAIDNVTSRRAEVGAKQSAADYVSNALDDRLRNQDVARSTVEDTDIASTSTLYALSTGKTNAAISIAAQANNLRESVLNDILETGIQVSN